MNSLRINALPLNPHCVSKPEMFCVFQVQDCHVIKFLSKAEYDGHTAALIVGGKNASPFHVRN